MKRNGPRWIALLTWLAALFMAVGSAGAKNAAYLAAAILGLKHDEIKEAYQKYRSELQGENR